MKKYITTILLAGLLSACQDNAAVANDTKASAPTKADSQVIRVAVESAYPPFSQMLPNGHFEGLDIDIVQAIAEKEGFQVKFVPQIWEGTLDRLAKGEIDMVADGVTMTEERKQLFDFSEPYYSMTMVLLTHQDSMVKKFDDIRNKRVAYQKNTSSERTLKEIKSDLDPSLGTESIWLQAKAVMGKTVDAAIGRSAPMQYYALKYPEEHLKIIPSPNAKIEEVGFPVKKGNQELREKLNRGLAAMKADGSLEKLKAKWLGAESDAKTITM